jgi:hypothetical protein
VASGSCPPPASNTVSIAQLALSGSTFDATGGLGQVFTLPLSSTATRLRVYNASSTPGTFGASFGTSICPGILFNDWPQSGHVTDPVAGHIGGCRKVAGYTGNALDVKSVDPVFPPACWINAAERAAGWYMTIRVDGCPSASCDFKIQVD